MSRDLLSVNMDVALTLFYTLFEQYCFHHLIVVKSELLIAAVFIRDLF